MAYKALYRSYRPTKFSEVVGQKHVIQTLKNALITNKTSHAYVFTGLRGIGKTTVARILAKAVNCENLVDGEPCNCCKNCLSIINDETTDIIELDAASNNGVDEIRNILEKVNFLPSSLKKKVYIIDEVHMLSTAAFNALLKTLEEPPAYVMFILATTEPHKIPMTILSRCQRFDFKQLTVDELSTQLKKVCEQEQIKATDEALNAISEVAEGGMRDALSILEQTNVFANEDITIEDVNSVTGRISYKRMIDLVRCFNENNVDQAIKIVNELIDSGKETSRLVTCVIEFCRDLLLFKTLSNVESSKYIYKTEEFKQLAEETDSKNIFFYIDNLVDIQNKIRFSNSQKIYLEVGIMRIASTNPSEYNLADRISAIEAQFESEGLPLNVGGATTNDSKINLLETKIKKINSELDKIDLPAFEEKISSKINLLEDAVAKVATDNTDSSINEGFESKLDQVNDVLNALIQDVDGIKNSISKEEAHSENENTNNEENTVVDSSYDSGVIFELIDKVTTIEEKLSNLKIDLLNERLDNLERDKNEFVQTSLPLENESTADINLLNNKIDELSDKVNSLTVNVPASDSSLSIKITQLEQKIDSIGVQTSLPISNNDNSALENEINDLRNKVDNLNVDKLTGIEKDIQALNEKVSDIPLSQEEVKDTSISEYECYTPSDDINALAERMNILEQNMSKPENESYDNAINELKSNYFVLTKALELLNEKFKDGFGNTNYTTKLDSVISKVDSLAEVAVKNTDIASIVQDIVALKDRVTALEDDNLSNENKEAIEKVISDFEELTNKVNDLTIMPIENEQVVEEKVESTEEQLEPQQTEEKVIEDQPEVEPIIEPEKEEQTENVTKVESLDEDITQKIYDVKILENTLHEARNPECKQAKPLLQAKWLKLEENCGQSLAFVARLLSSGNLVAVGLNTIIISFPNPALCNHLMEPKCYEQAKQVLRVTLGHEYNFLALPDITWKEKRMEYHGQYNTGTKFPKLSPINNPQLKILVAKKENILSDRQKALIKADEFFGKED